MKSNLNTGEAFLDLMAKDSTQRASAARALKSEVDLRRQALELPPARMPDFRGPGFDLIAEVKFRSPSGGLLTSGRNDPQEALRRARTYADGGAAMVSILTQPSAFRGSLEHLRRVAEACPIPVMRKDFLVHSYQVWEARAAHADGVLIVVRILDDEQARSLLDTCEQAGMFALLEAFDAADLKRAKALLRGRDPRQVFLGLNNRDLSNLKIDLKRCIGLSARLPDGYASVAESGLEEAPHARSVAASGYRLALVGSALMASDDPKRLIEDMLVAGRHAAGVLR